MHDLVIRGGMVVDGSGEPRRVADVAVDGERVSAVGPGLGRGAREVDATGLLVTPGFIDVHTHYDGQATWDPFLTPSSWHGVTTVVFGNCGVGFAPVRPGTASRLINLMEGVEDIPGTVLAEGVRFNWESFPDYLDALAASPCVADIGAQVPHAALRFYVMGERGCDHRAVPTPAEIERMGELLEAALQAGALGFSTSRTVKHRDRDGNPTPSLSAGEAELFGLARAMRRAGRGVLEVNSDFGAGDFAIMAAAAGVAGRPLSCLLLQVNNAPELWRDTLAGIRAERAAGRPVNGQVGCRPIGLVMGLDTSLNPFIGHADWPALAALPFVQRVARLRADAQLRQRLVEGPGDPACTGWASHPLERLYPLREPLDYEPEPAHSLLAQAAARGCSPWQLALDALLEDEGRGLLMHTFENYHGGDLEVVREMLLDEGTIMGLGDGGAHVATVCDASSPTFLLSHWARDRRRGPRIALERLVRKQTRDSALGYGLADRGLLQPGYRADINVIDFDRLRLRLPRVVHDLPAGGRRLIQRAEGYRHTFVAGRETLRDDEHTGELPGRLIR